MPASIRVAWGRNLADWRGDTSQEDFAEQIGIEQATLSKLENGKLKVSDDLKWLIAGRLGCMVDDIFPMPPIAPNLGGAGVQIDAVVSRSARKRPAGRGNKPKTTNRRRAA